MRRYEHQEMSDATTFAEVEQKLYSRGKPVDSKKVGNNTYLERWTFDGKTTSVGVRLRSTTVVVFHANGHIELNTGGWYTVTTKDRMNKWLPAPFSVYSKRGSWQVTLEWKTVTHERKRKAFAYQDWQTKKWRYYPSGVDRWQSKEVARSVPYFDGMILDPNTGSVVNGSEVPNEKARDKHNADMRRRIKRYVELYTDERIAELVETGPMGDCFFCMQTTEGTSLGDAVKDNDHLLQHMKEGYTMLSTLYHAVKAKGYREPYYIIQYATDMARRALSTYLRKRLLEATMVNH